MRAATNALTLCAVLALTSLPARCQHDRAFTKDEEANPLCENSAVMDVWENQRKCFLYRSKREKGSNKVSIAYSTGTSVNVLCSGSDSDSLTFSRNGKILIPDVSYGNYIQSYSIKLDPPASKYIFTCTDIRTTCEQSVNIMITPGFEVISPNVGICNDCIQINYTVQYGNSMSVLCSGPDAARLVMTKDGKALPTQRENATTIKSFDRTPDLQKSEYVCTDVDTTDNSSVIIQVVPKIYCQSRNKMIPSYGVFTANCVQQLYNIEYSGSIEVFCSGPRAVKLIGRKHDGTILLTENDNKNNVYINITKLGLTEYTCSDRELSDYVSEARVSVMPRMEVVSPSASIGRNKDGERMYTIKYEHPFEILCFGPVASVVIIHAQYYVYIKYGVQQIVVNNSTTRYIIKEPVWDGYARFTCIERGKIMDEEASVEVAVLPAVQGFRCVSYNVQFLNCSWTGIKKFTLHYYALFSVENGILTRICEKYLTLSLSEFCVFQYENNSERVNMKVLNFLIQSCGDVGCYNQTFHIDHLSLKLPPPEGLKVLRTTSRGAVLQWDVADLKFEGEYFFARRGDFHHKVQYWYSGIEPRGVNSSLVICDHDYCKIELNLPCPGPLYEVRVYHKLRATVEREMWSDPSSVTFYSEIESDNARNLEPTCSPEPLKTKEVMAYLVRELRKEMRPEIRSMKQKVRALQDKLDNIRKYVASTKEQDGQ